MTPAKLRADAMVFEDKRLPFLAWPVEFLLFLSALLVRVVTK